MNYRTISSYDAYYKNLKDMYLHGSHFMRDTDHGSGSSLPEWKKPERVPPRVKKAMVRPGDKVAVVSGPVKTSAKSSAKVLGRIVSTTE